MNFLAHASLSGNDDEILIGNFIADAVKGNQIDRFSDGIKKGIMLHREIDSYTDHHPVFIRSKHRIQRNMVNSRGWSSTFIMTISSLPTGKYILIRNYRNLHCMFISSCWKTISYSRQNQSVSCHIW